MAATKRVTADKRSLSPFTARLMVFKLVAAASKTWRRLKAFNAGYLLLVHAGWFMSKSSGLGFRKRECTRRPCRSAQFSLAAKLSLPRILLSFVNHTLNDRLHASGFFED